MTGTLSYRVAYETPSRMWERYLSDPSRLVIVLLTTFMLGYGARRDNGSPFTMALFEPFAGGATVAVVQGYVPERMVSDPAGYFVVYLDRQRQMLSLEHYANSGVLGTIIEGRTPAEAAHPISRNSRSIAARISPAERARQRQPWPGRTHSKR